MKNNLKISAIAMIMALLLATAAAPLLAESGSGSDSSNDEKESGSEKSSSDDDSTGSNSGSSGRSDSSEDKTNDKPKTDVQAKDGELKVEVTDGESRLKVEAKTNSNGQAEVKTEARGGFAGLISRLIASIFGRSGSAPSEDADSGTSSEEAAEGGQASEAAKERESKVTTPAPGITIDKSLSSGPGYPTGPLDISLPSTQLLLDRVGQVKGNEIKDRQYEVEFAAVPVTINGASYTATEIKVISNLKGNKHEGTIDVDIDVPLGSTLPAGHITLEYKGSAIISGSMISSGGVFKTSKMTGVFAGLVSEGTYSMSIIETGSTFGSLAIVSITTTSNI